MLKTYRDYLLLTYLIYVLLLVVGVGAGLYHRYTVDQLHTISKNLDEVELNQSRADNALAHFLSADNRDSIFYQAGRNYYVSTFRFRIKKNIYLLSKLSGMLTNSGINRQPGGEDLTAQLKIYSNQFEELRALSRKRGFRDFALEGKMREKIHAVENGLNDADKILMLMLRRHEKDFIIRKDTIYVAKFREVVAQLEAKPSILKDKQKRENIKEYKRLFYLLVKTDSMIGFTSHTGIRSKLAKQSETCIKAIEREHFLIGKQISESIRNLNIIMVILTISGLVFAGVMSIVISARMVKPFNLLADEINMVIQNRFEKNIEPQKFLRTSEFNNLLMKYNKFVRMIRVSMDSLEKKKRLLESKNELLQYYNEALQAANKQLKSSEDMLTESLRVKDKLFSVISHDIRGPLTSLKGLVYLIKEHPDALSPDTIVSHAGYLEKSIDQILILLNNILEWSRLQLGLIKPVLEWIDLNEIVKKVADLNSIALHDKEITLVNQVPVGQKIYADKNLTEIIIRNLLNNAIKYSFKGKSITISAYRSENKAVIQVEDEGKGISKEKLATLFETNIVTSEPGTHNEKGTGLGLVLCKEFAELQHGHLGIFSIPEKGTRIQLSYPVKEYKEEQLYELAGQKA